MPQGTDNSGRFADYQVGYFDIVKPGRASGKDRGRLGKGVGPIHVGHIRKLGPVLKRCIAPQKIDPGTINVIPNGHRALIPDSIKNDNVFHWKGFDQPGQILQVDGG